MIRDIHEPGSTSDRFKILRKRLGQAAQRLREGDPLREELAEYGYFAPAAYVLKTWPFRRGLAEIRAGLDELTTREIQESLADAYFKVDATQIINDGMNFRQAFGFSPRIFQR